MSSEELMRFLARRREETDRLPGDSFDASLVDEDPGATLDRHLRSALEELSDGEPVPLSRWLSLRLMGRLRRDGALDARVAAEVLSALEKELAGAAPDAPEEALSMELTGISPGSAILHLEPAVPALDDSAPIAVDESTLDRAITDVLELHRTVNGRGDVRRFAASPSMLRAYKELLSSLGKHGLELDMEWRSASGRRMSSATRSDDLPYFESLWQERRTEQVRELTGLVSQLSLNGTFRIKVGPNRNDRVFEVDLGADVDILSLGLTLGETVTVSVRQVDSENSLGIAAKVKYEFIAIVRRQGEFDSPE